MAKYYYIGVTRQREQVNGVIEAQDETEVEMKLRAMQIRPTEVSKNRGSTLFSLNFKQLNDITIGNPVDLKSMMIFTRQFSSLIDSGIPVVQCLDILWDQEKNKFLKKALGQIKSDVESGSGLGEALGKHSKIFSQFFIRIVEAGEVSGTLDIALRRVGIQLEKLGKIRSKVIGAMIYPVITVVAAILVMIFLLVFVIPEVAKLYSDSNAELPGLTVQVLALSDWFQENYSYVLFVLISIVGGFAALFRLESFRVGFDPLALKIPIFGTMWLKAEIARMTRTLSTLISSGVPLLNSFQICTKLIGNRTVKASLELAATYVAEGRNIADGLAKHNIFPSMVTHMVRIGEMTGKLDELLGKIADIYDDEVDDAVGAITGLIQPVLIVGVGLLIGLMLAAMYLPIFQLADKVAG